MKAGCEEARIADKKRQLSLSKKDLFSRISPRDFAKMIMLSGHLKGIVHIGGEGEVPDGKIRLFIYWANRHGVN